LGNSVTLWEIGNEVNGNWLGANVMPKIETMYDAVKAAGKPAALTLYYEYSPDRPCNMLSWVDANIPAGHRMRSGLDYVFISYYENQNMDHQWTQAELDSIFLSLAVRFPNAKLGFGEFGWGGDPVSVIPSDPVKRAALLNRFYGYRVPSVPNYIGGGFYWHFLQTMVPNTKPDWNVLKNLMNAYR
jgi:hypothetical protein